MNYTFITPDEFKNHPYGGFDLREALRSEMAANQSNQAELFIAAVTKHLMSWIDMVTFRNVQWWELTPFQLEHWKDALVAQTQYTYREGLKALGMMSGADDERGKILDLNYIQSVEVCQLCKEELTIAGLLNYNIINRRKTWPSGGNYGFF